MCVQGRTETPTQNVTCLPLAPAPGQRLCFIPDDGDDAVRIANDSRYGLTGAVWTGDPNRGLRIAPKDAHWRGDHKPQQPPFPLVPFGGLKESGIGRELDPEGLRNFLETRTIGVPLPSSPNPSDPAAFGGAAFT